jgi:ParB-like chromosome segregation protein Spo0J
MINLEVYGPPDLEFDGLYQSIAQHGVLVPLAVTLVGSELRVLSGHRRLACAERLGIPTVPCTLVETRSDAERNLLVLEYNHQRQKTFSQMMREADLLEAWKEPRARERRLANLTAPSPLDRRNSDDRVGRTDEAIGRAIGLGGKDLYRQARAIWNASQKGDPRALASVESIEHGRKTIFAAYKDLRRRDRFTTDFRPTPYDVWSFKHDSAYGIPHPGSIPPAIVAHALHYFTSPNALVVDPMAGGGVVLDVCQAMGRRCLAYDIAPARVDIARNDVGEGLPDAANDCDLIFADPPYHSMLVSSYVSESVSNSSSADWRRFLGRLAEVSYAKLRPGGYVALLLANQTEKDLPPGFGYIDHAFLGYEALVAAGFLPQRRISCPMDGAYLPQHVRTARLDGRLLGQVRDLLVMRKPIVSFPIPTNSV